MAKLTTLNGNIRLGELKFQKVMETGVIMKKSKIYIIKK